MKTKESKTDMLKYERHYFLQNKKVIAGCDEVGRGPLAGPVVCCSIIMPLKKELIVDGVNDSKKLTPKKRQELYERIIKVATCYNVSFINQATVDEINILQATKLGMKNSINALKVKPDIILVDAVDKLDINLSYQSIIKGDAKSYTIACASIVAKVERDKYMQQMHESYPIYNFFKHKGYGTKEHINAIKEHGECELHRKTFIKNFK